MSHPHEDNAPHPASSGPQHVPTCGLALAPGSASEEIFNSEKYEKFVESMVPHCHCADHLRPCDGVLAGGLCDNCHPERNSFCEDDDPADCWEYDDNEL